MEERRDISAPRSFGLLAVAAAWALFLTLIGSPEAILFTVPVFLLAAPLAVGRYVGEGLIEALRTSRDRPRSVQFLPDFIEPETDFGNRLMSGPGFGRAPPEFAN